MLGIVIVYLEKEYSYIILETNNDIPFVCFIGTIIIFLVFTLPYIKKQFSEYINKKTESLKNKQTGFITAIIISLSLTLLNFLPLLIINYFPYNKDNFETFDVLVQEKHRIQNGGSAPYFSLFTTSWRNLSSEKFKSKYNYFENFRKNDVITLKISSDFFKRIRIISIEKLNKIEIKRRE